MNSNCIEKKIWELRDKRRKFATFITYSSSSLLVDHKYKSFKKDEDISNAKVSVEIFET
jgi:hypothetical protein